MKVLQRTILFGAIILSLSSVCAFAQSNDRLDELLLQAPARLDSTAYIVLAAGGHVDESASPADALEVLIKLGAVSSDSKPDSPVTAQDLSWFLMKSLQLRGGVLYSLFPGPRYAYREMLFMRVVNGSGGPFRALSGEEVIRTLRYAIALKGVAQ